MSRARIRWLWSQWWDWWSQLQLASSGMAAAEATGSDNTFCVVSRASTELIFCIHRDFDVMNNVYKPRRVVACEYHGWWSQLYLVMKPTVGAHLRRMKPTEYGWSQLHICDELQSMAFDCLLSCNISLYINNILITILPPKNPPLVVLWKAMVL